MHQRWPRSSTPHNEVRDEIGDIVLKAFTLTAGRDEPRIHLSRPAATESQSSSARPSVATPSDERGDLLIRGLWQKGTDGIIDVRVVNLDAASHSRKNPHKVLRAGEREKKQQYLVSCLAQWRHFTPFVVSADGLLGDEAEALAKRLSSKLAKKLSRPYSVVRGYVNARLSLAIVRTRHLCLRGSRVPAGTMSYRRPIWDDDGALALFR